MKIWLSKNSEIPVREQLITQIKLGITGGNLPIGEKLPSTREIARRFDIHANTVSNAYQNLCDLGWLEFKKGSGFYVSDAKLENSDNTLDKLIIEFLQTTQKNGFTLNDVKDRLQYFSELLPPEQIVVIESEIEFQRILIEEIRQATGLKVIGKTVAEFRQKPTFDNSIITAMFDEKTNLQSILPVHKTCIFLQSHSVADSMKGHERPKVEDLIAIVSGWDKFLLFAKTFLIAANVDAESLLVRKTRDENWQKGLQNASLIICDTITALNFGNDDRIRTFQLISHQSLTELKDAALA